jgi:hypothetical protein
MDETRPNRRLCMGWALVFFWPLAATPLLVIPYLIGSLDTLGILLLTAILIVITVLVVCDFAIRLITQRPMDEPMYPCPSCGADIEHTPHRCGNCGARLIWGHEPGPRDLRSFHRQSIEH